MLTVVQGPIAEAQRRADRRWARFVFFAKAAVALLLAYAAVLGFSLLLLALAPTKGHSQTVTLTNFPSVTMTMQLPDSVSAGGTVWDLTATVTSDFYPTVLQYAVAWQTTDPADYPSPYYAFLEAPLWSVTDTSGMPTNGEGMADNPGGSRVFTSYNVVPPVPPQLCGAPRLWLGVMIAANDIYVTPFMTGSPVLYAVWVPVTVTCAPGVTPGPPVTAGPTPTPAGTAGPGSTPTPVSSPTPQVTPAAAAVGGATLVPNPHPQRVAVELGAAAVIRVAVYSAAMVKVGEVEAQGTTGWNSVALPRVDFHGIAFVTVGVAGAHPTYLKAYF